MGLLLTTEQEKVLACDEPCMQQLAGLTQGSGDVQAYFDAGGASFQEVIVQRRKSL
jgi:hypothetical protein